MLIRKQYEMQKVGKQQRNSRENKKLISFKREKE